MKCIFCGGFVTLPGNSTDDTECIQCGRKFEFKEEHDWFDMTSVFYVPKLEEDEEQ